MKKNCVWWMTVSLSMYTAIWVVSNVLQENSIDGAIQEQYAIDNIHQVHQQQIRRDIGFATDNNSIVSNSTNGVGVVNHVAPTPPLVVNNGINCSALVVGDPKEQQRAGVTSHRKTRITDRSLADQALECDTFKQRYRLRPNSPEEAKYPIAFSILCHKDASQVERLLRAIYQPQNVYCIHTDAKANADFLRAMRNVAACLPNVFIASRLEQVVYESYSRLQADINCMQDLVKRSEKWSYLINLVGQAFPLKTNLQLVRILKVYNGANDIEGLEADRFMNDRVHYKYTVRVKRVARLQRGPPRTNKVPGNLTLIRGSAYGVFSRAFLDYVLSDKLAQEFLEWSTDTRTPDEHYWNTLNQLYHNPFLNSPGGNRQPPKNNTWVASYSKWQKIDPCGGKFVHYVCIYGVKDLPDLVSRKELFANKFYEDYQPFALDCLEEWMNNRTNQAAEIDLTFYKDLRFVRGIH